MTLLLAIACLAAFSPPAAALAEAEPNNAMQNATTVTLSTEVFLNGSTHSSNDTVDFFAISSSVPAVLWVNLTSAWGCSFSCEELVIQYANGTVVVDQFGDPLSGEEVEFYLPASTTYYVRVEAGAPGGEYDIMVTRRTASVASNARIPILAGDANGLLGVIAWGAYDGPNLPVGFNLGGTGNGTIYDYCLTFSIRNEEPVPVRVSVPAGLRMDPLDSDVGRYIVTRDQEFTVPAWTVVHVDVVAAGETDEGAIASDGTIFFLDAMATGRLLQITTATKAGNYSSQAEAVALWSGFGNMSRSELKTWGASEASLNEAGRIHTAAGIQTDLNPPAPPPTNNTNTPSGGASSSLPLYLGIGLGVVVLAGVGAAVSRKKKKAAQGGQPASIYGAGQGVPAAPVPAEGPRGPPGTEMLGAAQPPAYSPQPSYAPQPAYPPQPAYQPQYQAAQYYAPPPGAVETVYMDEPACPKCNTAKQPGSTFCLQCGEFFVK